MLALWHQCAESRDVFMLRQLQTLVEIKVALLCDSDYNCYTSAKKNHINYWLYIHLEAHYLS